MVLVGSSVGRVTPFLGLVHDEDEIAVFVPSRLCPSFVVVLSLPTLSFDCTDVALLLLPTCCDVLIFEVRTGIGITLVATFECSAEVIHKVCWSTICLRHQTLSDRWCPYHWQAGLTKTNNDECWWKSRDEKSHTKLHRASSGDVARWQSQLLWCSWSLSYGDIFPFEHLDLSRSSWHCLFLLLLSRVGLP